MLKLYCKKFFKLILEHHIYYFRTLYSFRIQVHFFINIVNLKMCQQKVYRKNKIVQFYFLFEEKNCSFYFSSGTVLILNLYFIIFLFRINRYKLRFFF